MDCPRASTRTLTPRPEGPTPRKALPSHPIVVWFPQKGRLVSGGPLGGGEGGHQGIVFHAPCPSFGIKLGWGCLMARTSQVPMSLGGYGSGTWNLKASPSCTDRWALFWAPPREGRGSRGKTGATVAVLALGCRYGG